MGVLDEILEDGRKDESYVTPINLKNIDLRKFVETFRRLPTDVGVDLCRRCSIHMQHVKKQGKSGPDFFILTDTFGHKAVFPVMPDDTIGAFTKSWEEDDIPW